MKIERAVQNDAGDIERLLKQVNAVHSEKRPDLFKNATKYTPEQLAEIIADDNRPIFVAREDDHVIGYAFCFFKQFINDTLMTDIKTLYIDDLCVDETCRGKHVGKSLLQYVTSFAKSSGCYNLTLNVWSLNENALRFYEKNGLKVQKIGMETIL